MWALAAAAAFACDPITPDADGDVVLDGSVPLCQDLDAPGVVLVPAGVEVGVEGVVRVTADAIRIAGTLRSWGAESGPGEGGDGREGSAGGGGGFGGRGGAGDDQYQTPGGRGGNPYDMPGDAAAGSRGGGAGDRAGGAGGAGLTLVAAREVVLEPVGAIRMDGQAGESGWGGYEEGPGGGGGSGGGLVVDAPMLILAGALSARGGAGGQGSDGGGGGGGGRIRVMGELVAWPQVDVGGGPGGNLGSAWDAGEGGAPGSWFRGIVDDDADGIDDRRDNCPGLENAHQADGDEDGAGDLCDPCPVDPDGVEGACPSADTCAGDLDGVDADGDGWCADLDPDDRDPTVAPGDEPAVVSGAGCAAAGSTGGLGGAALAAFALRRRRGRRR